MSNSKEIKSFIGKKLVGVLDGRFLNSPPEDKYVLVFDDGRALVLSNSGGCWIQSAHDLGRVLAQRQSEAAEIAAVADALKPKSCPCNVDF